MAAYNNRAQGEIKLKQWHSAMTDCQRVLELEPGNMKGDYFLNSNKELKVLQQCTYIYIYIYNVLHVIFFFLSPSALLRRATVYHHMGNFQMAAEDLRMVLREEPQNAAATVGDRSTEAFDDMPVAFFPLGVSVFV